MCGGVSRSRLAGSTAILVTFTVVKTILWLFVMSYVRCDDKWRC